MNPTDFSVLLLAWDDADPAVVVLGGSALPPTLPLVYQLAAHHPVLALYPHLPAPTPEPDADAPAASAAPAPVWPQPGVIPNPLDADANGPGVRLLPAAGPTGPPPAGGSRLVGLDDLLPAIQGALPTAHSLSLAPEMVPGLPGRGHSAAANAPVSAPSQWPTHPGPRRATGWLAPAAPYAGAAAPAPAPPAQEAPSFAAKRESFPAPPPRPALTVPAAAAALATPAAAAAPVAAGRQSAASIPNAVPALFDEPVEEIGAAEASDLSAAEDDLVPDAAPPAAAEAEAAAPAPGWAVRQPPLEGLNFRMIQYARQAAQLVAGRQDFDVIYAPGWPAWLAALEIRNRSGQPMVLYAAALASDTAPAAERGWLLGLERMVLRRATLVLVPDAEVLRQLRAHHAAALGDVRIVPAADEVAVQLVLAEVAWG